MSEVKSDIIIEGDSIIRTKSQDVTEVLKFTKEQREAQTNCKKDMHHVARVPFALIQKLIDEGRLNNDVFRDKEQMKRAMLIVQSEYPHFMATTKNVLV